jgi:hypothetical protein
MPLGDDQKAMLRLLAQRDQGYEDIASLMGLSVEEVRARVTDALAELDREKAEGGDGGEAGVEPPPFREPSPEAPAVEAPAVEAPKQAAVSEKTEPAPPPPGRSRTPKIQLPPLPKDQGALRGLLAGAAVVLVIVLLLVTGVLGGGDESSSSTTSPETTSAETASGGGSGEGVPTTGGKQPTQAVLKAVNGSGASGQALFGRSGKTVVLLLAARGLDPSPPGSSYTLSLVRSPSQRLPLIATKVGNAGTISGRFQVANQVLGLLAGGFDEMEVSLVPNNELKVALAQAKESRKAPSYGGEAVLAGPVTGPIVEAGGEEP